MPTILDIIEAAQAKGFTRSLIASSYAADLELLVRPDADLDGTFTAICTDTGHTLRVNGWLHTFEVEG